MFFIKVAMKLKLVISLFMLLHFTFLMSDTIIDSVYATPVLDKILGIL